MLGDINKLFVFKSLLTTPNNVLPLHLKQTFPPKIWIFTEGDGIESRLSFKIFSTLIKEVWNSRISIYDLNQPVWESNKPTALENEDFSKIELLTSIGDSVVWFQNENNGSKVTIKAKLYIPSTINIWKKVFTIAFWADKKWAGFWQISLYSVHQVKQKY